MRLALESLGCFTFIRRPGYPGRYPASGRTGMDGGNGMTSGLERSLAVDSSGLVRSRSLREPSLSIWYIRLAVAPSIIHRSCRTSITLLWDDVLRTILDYAL